MFSIPIILYILTVISIITLSLSTYGLGKEDGNKSGIKYQVSSVFTTISASFIVFVLIIQFVQIIMGSSNKVYGVAPRTGAINVV